MKTLRPCSCSDHLRISPRVSRDPYILLYTSKGRRSRRAEVTNRDITIGKEGTFSLMFEEIEQWLRPLPTTESWFLFPQQPSARGLSILIRERGKFTCPPDSIFGSVCRSVCRWELGEGHVPAGLDFWTGVSVGVSVGTARLHFVYKN